MCQNAKKRALLSLGEIQFKSTAAGIFVAKHGRGSPKMQLLKAMRHNSLIVVSSLVVD
jgi:hypothetical protein